MENPVKWPKYLAIVLIVSCAYLSVASLVNFLSLPTSVSTGTDGSFRSIALQRTSAGLKNARLSQLSGTVIYGIGLIGAFGVLMRKNWGRPTFTVAMALVIGLIFMKGTNELRYLDGVEKRIEQSTTGGNVTQEEKIEAMVGLEFINDRKLKENWTSTANIFITLLILIPLFMKRMTGYLKEGSA